MQHSSWHFIYISPSNSHQPCGSGLEHREVSNSHTLTHTAGVWHRGQSCLMPKFSLYGGLLELVESLSTGVLYSDTFKERAFSCCVKKWLHGQY